jgi:hypothetical protein
VQGTVWFAAHVVAVALTAAYVLCAMNRDAPPPGSPQALAELAIDARFSSSLADADIGIATRSRCTVEARATIVLDAVAGGVVALDAKVLRCRAIEPVRAPKLVIELLARPSRCRDPHRGSG